MGRPHSAKIGRPMVQKDTGVETTYGKKLQRETAIFQMDRRSCQDRGESLDAGRIGLQTLEINWGGSG